MDFETIEKKKQITVPKPTILHNSYHFSLLKFIAKAYVGMGVSFQKRKLGCTTPSKAGDQGGRRASSSTRPLGDLGGYTGGAPPASLGSFF